MNLSNFISWRYYLSKKKTSAINFIAIISMAIFTIGTAVMLIILSFMNGLESLVKEMNSSFDPDLKISYAYGKTFSPDTTIKWLETINEINSIASVLEENVVVRYADRQEIAQLKGVSTAFREITSLDSFIIQGGYYLDDSSSNYALFGSEIAGRLNINIRNSLVLAGLYVPVRGKKYNTLNPESSLNYIQVTPGGIVLLNEHTDKDLILVPISRARKLLGYKNGVSAIELSIKSDKELKLIQKKIKQKLGNKFSVKNRAEQNEASYAVFKSEKLATFAILTLILLISAFNIVGALTMLVIEKKEDILTLKGMGVPNNSIRMIFLKTGMLITITGLLIGLLIGGFFVYIQLTYGIIELQESFLESFPIQFLWSDVGFVSLCILTLGLLASIYPSFKSV